MKVFEKNKKSDAATNLLLAFLFFSFCFVAVGAVVVCSDFGWFIINK